MSIYIGDDNKLAMKIIPRQLNGVFEVHLKPHLDARGFFMRTYECKVFQELGIDRDWVEENHSRSEEKGIIRGLHFQHPPYSETKLIRAVVGSVLDVFVDLRPHSATFGQWDSVELSADNKVAVLVPRGFAHGFCTLTDCSEVVYKVDNVYTPSAESGLIWNDPALNIAWPTQSPILSAKDQAWQTLDALRSTLLPEMGR